MEEQEKEQKQLQSLLRHINLVIDAAKLIAEKYIEKEEMEFGRKLIANGYLHDNTKFYGIEWQILTAKEASKEDLLMALKQHQETNRHHPEHWGGIEFMPPVYIAEMVCDWYARSVEFGTDMRQWIKETALEKYGVSPQGKIYKQIKEFTDLLLEKPFKSIKSGGN